VGQDSTQVASPAVNNLINALPETQSGPALGLLRAIAQIADTAPALAIEWADANVIDLPLGAVALNWLRIYLPLAETDLPQLAIAVRIVSRPPRTCCIHSPANWRKFDFHWMVADYQQRSSLRAVSLFRRVVRRPLRRACTYGGITVARRSA